ncbi:MAG TPA: hypothetical protein VKS80_11505, partial [Trinickia sp.]|nr:hypothetical protein [Trinickia sp.]
MSELYEYTIDLRTLDDCTIPLHATANLDLDALIASEMTVAIELEGIGTGPDGGTGAGKREISGLVTQAEFL